MTGTGHALATAAAQLRRRYAGGGRGADYARLLRLATDAGYELVSLREFAARSGQTSVERPLMIALRHDVDIADVAGNEMFHELELAAGARSTFYFRWTTARPHRRLIDRLLADGFEVGYHYEEAATIAKRECLADRASLEQHREEVAQLMRWRTAEFRRRWNPRLRSAAAHGDWANRRLGLANHELVTRELLTACGLEFEAYGDEILGRADVYVSDVAPPQLQWRDDYGLEAAIADGHRWICMLAHERRWHVNRVAGLEADVRRACDEVSYRLRARLRPLARRRDEGQAVDASSAADSGRGGANS